MLIPVIGLEIHLQLKTKSKMFCACPAHDVGASPNTNVCAICLGNPGTLPVPNEQAIRYGTMMGLALNCSIASHSKFDRKNYFYPDLPKAYQISQYDLPIAANGHLEVDVPDSPRERVRIGITRAHLEEDAAKNTHGVEGKTLVDYNRGGTPLIEIVTEPDFTNAKEAKAFLHELQRIARYLDVSNADMEKGNMRCDANISLREIDENGQVVGARFNPKTEIKNLNSFRHVERALEFEIKRQTKLWEDETPVTVSTTRGWNDVKGVTELQRSKEDAADYRYFPEPDIPPLNLAALAEELKLKMPELPAARRARMVEEYALKPSDAAQMCDDPALADFAEQTFSELQSWLSSVEGDLDWETEKPKMARLVSGWLLSKLGGLMMERSIDIRICKITPENFAEFITLIATTKLNGTAGLKVLNAMLDAGADPTHIMEDLKLGTMDDAGALADIIDRALASNPAEVLRYQAGEEKLLPFFVGLVMKETQGTADPGVTRNMLLVKLKS
ncbi:glutaminyl-tRNA synthase (glutamine-hydrolyzing) subunit B [Candidatus Uhrbacteria bacterium RIFCSPHIGHO2_02_FULL_47_44]|uniref:Aspartyl/glutamyl-tRNA(Asn/Gln) amidotransferase subunit B n=1 Tax=Candidatus Uhrbacteria bacterium RIFCSPLOWO2_02_FULL_48_18 TaxID=1802408 RepID=A0A1F7V7E5_9BACT|nr:MAG: glutaminyl-tRNA synthase (glutamine-hydrolyzing) subunit B [Candidatus Uhrbacteria bacterium RIFCSPHIGHO2_01_FULL_47_10]OGL70385.1 MAG: glutaminyl-tRNA synthase (glutamine-hydrolyzing) subunit B [Candidatus Uhrbacteria bacterium RIFCSPHIGHO2_02_FULL_47_44]OGL77021.1 MAG: glutaminyl-tRNA synthase (glutamine-hydrolyzing) subunit B [Candidatus Uhrbacteria bacterium RIFCSPHIGHO2_12_FULL_47_12]OGL82548.1 MAG: glutaminyl-tRNA synthase (glutamine-hydrolyzing) subunit B [Candidatus Uhrbacteria b